MSTGHSHVAARCCFFAPLAFIITTPFVGAAQSPLDSTQTEARLSPTGFHLSVNRDPPEDKWEDDLYWFLISIIALLEGNDGSTIILRTDAPESWMNTMENVYTDTGIRADMTEKESLDLLDFINKADLQLDTAPSSVDDLEVAGCEITLDDMRSELLGSSVHSVKRVDERAFAHLFVSSD